MSIKTPSFSTILLLLLISTCSFAKADPIDLQQFAQQNQATYKVANTTIISSALGDGLVLFTTPQGSDAISDLYLLQGATGISLNLRNAEIVFSQASIIIRNPADTKIYTFYIEHESSLHSKLNPAQVFSNNVGYGLVKYFNLNSNFTKTNLESILPNNTIQGTIIILAMIGGGGHTDPDGGPTCIAGGCGSSSCSLDASASSVGVGCSVTCNGGYYACCGSVSVTANQCGCRPVSECSGSNH